MQNQAVASPAEQSTAKEYLGAQRGRLAIGGETTGALEFSEQVEQQQDAPEGRFGGKEFLQAKSIGGQIVFQFGNAVFHVGPAVVVAPDFFRGNREVADEDAEGVAGNVEQFSSQRGALGAQLFPNHHEAAGAGPARQLEKKIAHTRVALPNTPSR